MQESTVTTYTVPAIAPNVNPATLARASKVPLRVVIRNIGGSSLILAHSVNDIASGTISAATFLVAIAFEETFVLAPQQGLFAVSSGIGGRVSVMVSDALPLTTGG
jgi:hypothetical protein